MLELKRVNTDKLYTDWLCKFRKLPTTSPRERFWWIIADIISWTLLNIFDYQIDS